MENVTIVHSREEEFSNINEQSFKNMPRIMEQDGKGEASKVHRIFYSLSGWLWLATEFDPVEEKFFGKVHGHEKEWCYFSLEDLKSAQVRNIDKWHPISMKATEQLMEAVFVKVRTGV